MKRISSLNGGLKTVVAMLLCIVATCSFSSCSHSDDDEKQPVYEADASMADSRTVLVYMVAENSLDQYANEDISEMLKGIHNARLKKGDNLVIYVDDAALPRIYCVNGADTTRTLSTLTVEKEYGEELNSSSPSMLGEVIDYVKTHHSADSYGLVLWSHGSGWTPYNTDNLTKSRSFGIDNNRNSGSDYGSQMDIYDMAEVLNKKCMFDFIFFDACFMQTIEVAYELRHCTKYLIGSPAEIPGPGADYSTMIASMFKEKDYAKLMVDTYFNTYSDDLLYGVVISAIDESALENFAAYMKSVCANNRKAFMDYESELSSLNYFDFRFYYRNNMPDFFDIKGLAQKVLSAESYAVWLSEFEKIIVDCKFTSFWYSGYSGNETVIADQCGGVSMFVPFPLRYRSFFNSQFQDKIQLMEWGKYVWE